MAYETHKASALLERQNGACTDFMNLVNSGNATALQLRAAAEKLAKAQAEFLSYAQSVVRSVK